MQLGGKALGAPLTVADPFHQGIEPFLHGLQDLLEKGLIPLPHLTPEFGVSKRIPDHVVGQLHRQGLGFLVGISFEFSGPLLHAVGVGQNIPLELPVKLWLRFLDRVAPLMANQGKKIPIGPGVDKDRVRAAIQHPGRLGGCPFRVVENYLPTSQCFKGFQKFTCCHASGFRCLDRCNDSCRCLRGALGLWCVAESVDCLGLCRVKVLFLHRLEFHQVPHVPGWPGGTGDNFPHGFIA